MRHDGVGAVEAGEQAGADSGGVRDEGLAHPVARQPAAVGDGAPHQAFVLGVRVHARRREVERVGGEREAFTTKQRVEAGGREERDVVPALGQQVGGSDERRDVAEVRARGDDDSGDACGGYL